MMSFRTLLLVILLIAAELACAAPTVTFPTGRYRRPNEHMPVDIHFDTPASVVEVRSGDGLRLRFDDGAPQGYLGVSLFAPAETEGFSLSVDGKWQDFAWPPELLARSNEVFLLGIEEGVEIDESQLSRNLRVVRVGPDHHPDLDRLVEKGFVGADTKAEKRDQTNIYYDWGAFDAILRPSLKGYRLGFPFCATTQAIAADELVASQLYAKIRRARGGDVDASKAFSVLTMPTRHPPKLANKSYVNLAESLIMRFWTGTFFLLIGGGYLVFILMRVKRRNATRLAVITVLCALAAGAAAIQISPDLTRVSGFTYEPVTLLLDGEGSGSLRTVAHYADFAGETQAFDVDLARTMLLARPLSGVEILLEVRGGEESAQATIPAGAVLGEVSNLQNFSYEIEKGSVYHTETQDGAGWVIDESNGERIAINDFGARVAKIWPEAEWQADYWVRELFVNGRNWRIFHERRADALYLPGGVDALYFLVFERLPKD